MTCSLVITLVKVMFYEVDGSKKESCKLRAKIGLIIRDRLGRKIIIFLAKLVKGCKMATVPKQCCVANVKANSRYC